MARPLVLAHRGASADAPENTLAAFAEARRQGADGVELDVRRTADGALVLHHDVSLPDGRRVVDCPAAQLPASVPTLEQALDECAGMLVNVEIKNVPIDSDFDPDAAIADAVVALLQARHRRDRVLVSCFGIDTIDRVKELDPQLPTGLLTFRLPSASAGIDLAAERGHDAVHPFVGSVDADLVERARRAGLSCNVWTVDDPDRIRELAGLGVDGIVSNRPAVALGALRT